jgi:hypothetical protein
MDNHHAHHVAETAQNIQHRAASGLLNLIEGLLKAYKDKRKSEHRIEIKVDGKTKFKATVDKTGRMRVAKNELSGDEILALQNYFKSIPNPPINPKDFDVTVDGNRVLATKDGKVVTKAQPQQSDAFAETESASPSAANTANADPVRPSDPEPAPITPEASKPEPLTPEASKPEPITPKASKPEPVQLPIPEPTSTEQSTAAAPKVNDTGPIPTDYGLGKPISDEAIVATGDRALVAAHGGLEAKRLELNDCVRRGKEPGFSHLNDRATVLRGEINSDLPKFAERLNESMAQGKYKTPPTTAPGLDRDMPLTQKKQEAQTQSKKQVLAKR